MWKFLVSLGYVLSLRFVSLPSHSQAIKMYCQIDSHFKKVVEYYKSNGVEGDSLVETDKKEIFMYLDGKKMGAFLMVDNGKCYSIKERKEYGFLIFYYCTVIEEYRGKKLSYKLMKNSVESLRKTYNLHDDTFMTLHMSPYDKMMPVAAKMYYSLGFRQGMFIKYNPVEMRHKPEEIVLNSRNLFDVARNEHVGVGDGFYFLLYCRLKDFGKSYEIPENAIELTKKLYETLVMREKLVNGEEE